MKQNVCVSNDENTKTQTISSMNFTKLEKTVDEISCSFIEENLIKQIIIIPNLFETKHRQSYDKQEQTRISVSVEEDRKTQPELARTEW